MTAKAYHLLAKRINKPPMPLKTLINDVLMEILALLFTEEEALVVSKIPLINSTADKVARLMKRPVSEIRPVLDDLAKRGLIFSYGEGEEKKYLVLPVFPGIYEAQMCIAPDNEKTRKFAKLYDEYYTKEFSENMLARQSKIFRIIPIEKSIPANQIGIVPSDNIREVIDRYDAWSLANYCACRRRPGRNTTR